MAGHIYGYPGIYPVTVSVTDSFMSRIKPRSRSMCSTCADGHGRPQSQPVAGRSRFPELNIHRSRVRQFGRDLHRDDQLGRRDRDPVSRQ